VIFDIKRLTKLAGKDFSSSKCRVRNPQITARDSIEIGSYIVAQDKRIAELKNELESAKFFQVDVVRCLSKIAWEHNHNEIPKYMDLARKCILKIEEQSKQAKGGAE
jgi:hypothetical protein